LETRTDAPSFLPPTIYSGEKFLGHKLVSMAEGWGGKSQVRLGQREGDREGGKEGGREGGREGGERGGGGRPHSSKFFQ
jgi:hypothetical protein